MRRVLIGDILALAAALNRRSDALTYALQLCDEAHAAHGFCKRTGRLHPEWGNGSLMSRAMATGTGLQADWGSDGLASLGIAARAIGIWRKSRLGLSRPLPMC